MKTYIYSSDYDLNARLKEFITNKVFSAMYRFEHLINTVEIRVKDENGPKGGEDKSCVLCIKTDQFPDIIVKDTESDVHASVSRAVLRAKRTLARRLKQSQTIDKQRLVTEMEQLNTQ